MEDDGIRSLEDPWNYNAQLCATLTELGIPFIEIGDNVRDMLERVEMVERHLPPMYVEPLDIRSYLD